VPRENTDLDLLAKAGGDDGCELSANHDQQHGPLEAANQPAKFETKNLKRRASVSFTALL